MAATFPVAKEARIAVAVVPILAPMIMGMALGRLKTPPPIRATTKEVVKDEDWTRAVASIPIKRPTKGSEVVAMRLRAKSSPKSEAPFPMSLMLKRKKYIKTKTETILKFSLTDLIA